MSSKHQPTEASSNQTRLLTAKQAAQYLGIRPKTFWEWTNKGVIPAVKIPGANPRYDLRDLEALIERYKSYPAAQGAEEEILARIRK